MATNGGAPEYLYLVVPLVILAGCVYLRPCLSGQHNRGEDAYTALLSPSVRTARNAFDRRIAIAVREAKLGFYVCLACGFTNALRVKSCALCGAAAKTKKKGVKAFFSEAELGTRAATEAPAPAPSLLPWASLTNRQRRVRRRREWTRQLHPDGSIIWSHADDFRDEALRSFPSYVLHTARTDSREKACVASPHHVEIDIEPPERELEPAVNEILSIQHATNMLQNEFSTTRVMCVEATAGDDASVHTTGEADTASSRGRDSITHATLDFPSKLAHFITAVAGLFNDAADLDEDGEDSRNKSRFFIDRENLLSDSITAIATITPHQARGAIRVEFTAEQGIDAGGVYREWFLLLNQAIVAPEAGLFVCVDEREQTFYLNPHSEHVLGEHHLAHYLAAGRLLGRALLEGNVTGFHLALPLLKIMLGLPVNVSDLEFFDPEAYKHLMWLLQNDGVDALGLDFTVSEKKPDGTTRDVELVSGGRAIDVTDANKREYVDRKLRYLLVDSLAQQLQALLRGVYEIVPIELLVLFDAEELDLMLSGSDEIDVDDWQAHTVTTTELIFHPAYELFWKVVRELDHEELRRLLQFATGSTRVPSGGFGALTSQDGRLCLFTLKGVQAETTHGYLHSHACFNTLDVPLHGFIGSMRTAVRAAIIGQRIGFTTA